MASEEKLDIGIKVRAFTREDAVVIGGGLLAGILGSLAMLVVLAVGSLLEGRGPLFPLQLIAATVFGPHVVHDPATAGVMVTGFLIHVLVGSVVGLIFGYFADALHPLTNAGLVLAGMSYGIAIYLVSFLYLVPNLCPLLAEQSWLAGAIGHLAYGATLALYWPITDRMKRRGDDVAPIRLPVVSRA